VYVTRRRVLIEQNSLYGERLVGFPMDPAESVNIDSIEDFERAEALIQLRRGLMAGVSQRVELG
jgi:CMP-N-acetylneuraminic acid synthetase